MTKNSIILTSIIVILLVAGGAYAIWNMSQTPKAVTPAGTDTSATTTTANPAPVTQPAAPSVQTSSDTAPYISTVVVKGSVNPNGALTTYWYEYGQTSALGTQTSAYLVGSGYTPIYTPAYITGLLTNTVYYFRLSAKNAMGTVNGAIYTFKTNSTPAPVGTAPTTSSANATDVTRTTVNLHGQINPNNSTTTYWFEYGTSSDLGLVTSFQTMESSNASSAVSVSLSSLQPFTKYYFRLNAQNQFGTVNGEILNFTTKGPSAATAPAVTTNSASAIANSSAKLNATINPNGAATTYWFEYSDNSLLSNVIGSTTPEQSLNSGTAPANVSATINNLNNNTTYYVRAFAKNQYGTDEGDVESFTTKR